MKLFLNLTMAVLSCSQLTLAQDGIDPAVTYQKKDSMAEEVQRVEMGVEEFTRQVGEKGIKYWNVELFGLDGARWARLTDKSAAGVLGQLKVEQEFENFYCGLLKKTEAPCENRTYLKPKGPIAVLADSRAIAKRDKESADEIEKIIFNVQSAIKLLLHIEWKKLPELKFDLPFVSYVELLKNIREQAIRLKFELENVGHVTDSKISNLLLDVATLEAQDTQKLGKRLGLDLGSKAFGPKKKSGGVVNIAAAPQGLEEALNKYLKDRSENFDEIVYVGSGGYKNFSGEYENFLAWKSVDGPRVDLVGIIFKKERGFKFQAKESAIIFSTSAELMISGEIKPSGDDYISIGVARKGYGENLTWDWINLGIPKDFDRQILNSIRAKLEESVRNASLSVRLKKPNPRDAWRF